MLKALLGIDSFENVTGFEFREGWLLALVLIAIAVAVTAYLYRSDERLSRRRRTFMAVCQGLALLVLIVIILKPFATTESVKSYQRSLLVLVDTSRSMNTDDAREEAKDVVEAAKVLGKAPLDQLVDDADVASLRQQVGPLTRFDLARAALALPFEDASAAASPQGSEPVAAEDEWVAQKEKAKALALRDFQAFLGIAGAMLVVALALGIIHIRNRSRSDDATPWALSGCVLALLAAFVTVAAAELKHPQIDIVVALGLADPEPAASRFAPDEQLASNWPGKLDEQFQVRLFSFDDQVRPEGSSENLTEWIEDREPDGDTSQIGSAIDEAVARYSGQKIAGIVVLSDFANVEGKEPVEVAQRMKKRGIPVYSVPVGLPAPPDIRVRRVIGPEVAFKGDKVLLRIQIESSGYDGSTAELSMKINGELSTNMQVKLTDGTQFEELVFSPPEDASGSVELDVAVAALAGETSIKNNQLGHKVRIIDEKIKVLYVEGMPRWEYRYLRWVLLRDDRLDVHFWMTQGDPALAKASSQHLASFPEDVKDALKYDLIILGDVPASKFNATQMGLIDNLVKKSGGSLLMVAGPMAAPATYRDTPIEKILPVHLGSGQWEGVGTNIYPIVTADGLESKVMSFSDSTDPEEQIETNERVWSRVRPMYALPQLAGAKSGATVLLTLPKSQAEVPDYPLVAWQRYGTGKSLFVATEDLWRMRREVGPQFHERFWGQAIQFLTLSRLLGQNKQITIETGRATYNAGEPVKIYANVLNESFEPQLLSSYTVELLKKGIADSAVDLKLTPVPGKEGLLSAVHLATDDGTYLLRSTSDYAEISNETEFDVKTISLEDRETGMDEATARQVAELSGGKQLSMTDLAKFPGQLGKEQEYTSVVRKSEDLWDAPLLYLLLVGFAGTEWYFRRRDNLV